MSNEDSYTSSDQLASLDNEITSTSARLDAIGRERGEALNAKAAGTEGAAEKLESLRSERNSLKDYLSDLREARQIEVERLQSERTKALETAKQARRDEIKKAVAQLRKVAGKLDKNANAIIDSLKELEQAGSVLASLHGAGAGNSASREALGVLIDRLQEYSGGSRSAPGHLVIDRMVDESAVATASIPNSLDDLQTDEE